MPQKRHSLFSESKCGKLNSCYSFFYQMEGRMVYQLAIDRPSHKFVSFLKKYHGFKNAIPQVGFDLL